MIKVSDYIIKRLIEHGIKQVFMVTGGGAMHLNDSVGKSGIDYICNHHEQACAFGAEGYFRVSGKPVAVIVTSGPGGTNAITGVLSQWTDSIPAIYISGQMKRATLKYGNLRQLGDQEADIVSLVNPITKFAYRMREPEEIGYLMDRALHEMSTGRYGPVWIDVPLDIQSALIEEKELDRETYVEHYLPIIGKVSEVIYLIKNSNSPLILAGHGIRLAGAAKYFLNHIDDLNIRVVTSFNGFDLIPSSHRLYAGRMGTLGQARGNAALQNADLLISIGSRNNIRQISYDWQLFAKNAKKVIVDIDAAELEKPYIKGDISIQANAIDFLVELIGQWRDIESNKLHRITYATS